MTSRLKFIRLAFALAIFILFALAFSGIPAIMPGWAAIESITFFQFVPSILKCIAFVGFLAGGFLVILILTFFFGRVYCSFLCPLGILQDFISRMGKIFRKRKIYRFSKAKNILRFSILALVVLSVFSGSIFLLNILDPYSIFGKIWTSMMRPLAIISNDGISMLLNKAGSYWLNPVGLKAYYFQALVYPAIILLVIAIMAAFRGRLFCNTICPVGSLLGLISKVSFFKIKINETACTRCGKCSTNCKAECIDIKNKEVDFSRCVGCYNCLKVCPEKGIDYKRSYFSLTKPTENSIESTGRREFFKKSLIMVAGTTLIAMKAKAESNEKGEKSGKNSFKKKTPVTPPGSHSIEHFTKSCTACQLCVSACPTQVLQPSFKQYGFAGIMLPHMEFTNSFCNYDCTKCSEVCPNGAIMPITSAQKKSIQIGKVIFLKENCIVYTEETSCGACSEHCPTKAVKMVTYKGMLTIPETDQNICVGCGACEFACPTHPFKAIYVEGNAVHKTAFKPKEEKIKEKAPSDFPF